MLKQSSSRATFCSISTLLLDSASTRELMVSLSLISNSSIRLLNCS